ncbi:MAG TPA: GIY-YIG nuclease family protein [Terriglobia bacterium]|nr:GIY-YIG nuclease family protein [Terriglobia bacterium]
MRDAFVYMLASRPLGTIYIGVTGDLVRRCAEHRAGTIDGFTNRYEIKRLVWFESTPNISAAIQREKTLKHWPRTWKVALIEKNNPHWDDLFHSIAR